VVTADAFTVGHRAQSSTLYINTSKARAGPWQGLCPYSWRHQLPALAEVFYPRFQEMQDVVCTNQVDDQLIRQPRTRSSTLEQLCQPLAIPHICVAPRHTLAATRCEGDQCPVCRQCPCADGLRHSQRDTVLANDSCSGCSVFRDDPTAVMGRPLICIGFFGVLKVTFESWARISRVLGWRSLKGSRGRSLEVSDRQEQPRARVVSTSKETSS
jgi:hypothetical protein